MFADLIITNGRIYTMDASLPLAEAVAVAGDRILAVGTESEIATLRRPTTDQLDLRGRSLLPAFSDSHIHLLNTARARQRMDLSKARSRQDAAATVAQRAAETPAGHWLIGNGWNRNIWHDTALPTKRDLDRAAPDTPVVLNSKDLHSMWVNSRALAQAGINASTPDPPGGLIVREAGSGEPSGILLERACTMVSRVYPPPSVADCVDAIKSAIPMAWQAGITGIHQMGDKPDCLAFRAFQQMHQEGELDLRVLYYFPRESLETVTRLGLRSGFGDQRLRIGGIKLFADGSLGSHSAWMLEPFEDEPDNRGVPWHEPEELQALVRKASDGGLAVAVHALGDRANRETIKAIAMARQAAQESSLSKSGPTQVRLRHRIEHAQLLHPDDIPLLAEWQIIASMQPVHCPSDVSMAVRHWGEPRCAGAYAWRSVLDCGARLAFGSDAPVESLDVLTGIQAAVTRRPAGGSHDPDVWHPEQRVSAVQAVHAYTMGAAYAAGEEHWRGSVSPGKLADMIVLSNDIFRCPAMDIAAARVDLTLFGGRIVHQA